MIGETARIAGCVGALFAVGLAFSVAVTNLASYVEVRQTIRKSYDTRVAVIEPIYSGSEFSDAVDDIFFRPGREIAFRQYAGR